MINACTSTHEANGNLTTLTTAVGVSQYDYDALNRLVRDAGAVLPEITYTYDPNGNRLTRTEAGTTTSLDYPPNNNRLTAIGGDIIFRSTRSTPVSRCVPTSH